MRKAVLKRIKITKKGKLLRRRPRLNHFNAKKPRLIQLKQKKLISFSKTMNKKIKRYWS